MQTTLVQPPTGHTAPPYSHQEYPKWLHFEGKPSVLVEDAEAEARILQGLAPVDEPAQTEPAAPVPGLVGGNDERTMLLKIAAERGIRTDGRWNLAKLRKAVEAASE